MATVQSPPECRAFLFPTRRSPTPAKSATAMVRSLQASRCGAEGWPFAAVLGASTMTETKDRPICEFHRLIPDAPPPQRAHRSADGTLPVAAYSYCEPVASASAYGWYIYPPVT